MKWVLSWLNLRVMEIRLYFRTLPEGWERKWIFVLVVLGLIVLGLLVRNCVDVGVEEKPKKQILNRVKSQKRRVDSLKNTLKIIGNEGIIRIDAIDGLSDEQLRDSLEAMFGNKK